LINIRRDEWRRAAVRRRSATILRPATIVDGSHIESALSTKRAVWRALDVLHPRRRAIVIMSEIDGMDQPAIARVLGISVMTVRWHLSMARRELRRALKPYVGGVK
jgi:RNA polymerase sigma factor (sigma-70 family)